MPKVSFKMPDKFLDRISALGNRTDEIVPKVLKAGGEVMLARVKYNLQAVIGKGTKHKSRSTGDLVNALGISGARLDRDGNYNIKVGFGHNRRDGKNNTLIAGVIEYGKQGQPLRPFLKPAKSAAKNACIIAMKNALEDEINNI